MGWSSSWSCVLGTVSMLMNNGEDPRKRRGRNNPETETGEESRGGGRDVHLTGGGVPPLDSSRFNAHAAIALTPPPTLLLCLLIPSLFCLFSCCSLPALTTCSIQNIWFNRVGRWGEPLPQLGINGNTVFWRDVLEWLISQNILWCVICCENIFTTAD